MPTGILLKTLVERNTPVMAPQGDNKRTRPMLPSVNANFSFIDGIAATQVPKSKLEAANKKPTASTGFMGNKLLIFLKNTSLN